MGNYEYDGTDDEFRVKNSMTGMVYTGKKIVDLINRLDEELYEYRNKYNDEKDKSWHYRSVLMDLINE